ncbi:hypothetical protein [uncultured Prevotella sp.]|uniref:hypothetical protein n=1 Tax=uncultured Prevotella sp. TaxID=159272 RepID=UPI00261D6968|nr:hypothetical protein [uncultured Prevotella sp.]
MNKKFLSALLLGALTVTSTGTLVSCKDYDDDITNLQEQIDKNAKAIKEINDLIAKGGVITGTTSVEGGVKVTLSNGTDFLIKNGEKGADGLNGVSWTIGEDGFWYKDGKKTEYKALGKDGEKGEQGPAGPAGPAGPQGPQGQPGQNATASGENGKYYVPNATTGKFDIYKDGKLVESTNISFLGSGVITAVKDDAKKTLTLYGVTGGSGENKAVVISMSGTLSSLSYRPALYLDGIETIEYPWLSGVAMKTVAATASKNFQDKVIKGFSCKDYVADATQSFVYGPAWSVEYDASPWNAAVTEEDLAGYNVLNPTAIYNTRAAVAALGAVTSPAYAFPGKDGGKKLFSMNNGTGVLTTGLQIENPDKFTNEDPTKDSRNDVNTVALRVKNSEGTEVVADYALVQPEKTVIDGMVWSQQAKCIDENANEKVRTGDEDCGYFRGELTHVWTSPVKALQDVRGAALSLYYEDEVGVDLSKYVAVRLVKSKNLKANQKPEYITVSPEEALQWGLTFHYNIVNYKLDTNETSESMFLKKINAKDTDGKFRAQNVKENLAIGEAANASVGRMPLVQVTVTNHKGNVVLDGYILLYITKYADANGKNDKWAVQETTFNPCDANDVFTTTWDQFNDLMLTQYLDMTKETFDHQYAPELFTDGSMAQFADYKDKGEQDYNMNALGTVTYKGNAQGNTNHTWQWTIPAEEIEAKLHHSESYTFTTWVRFKALDKKSAKYPYIYVKLTAKVNNKKTNTYAFGEKNDKMYWFDNGKVVQFDAVNPFNGGYLATINRSVRSTLMNNIESFNAPQHRYYFVPGEITVKDEYTGKTYTLTPQSSASDVAYNQVFCKFVPTDVIAYKDAESHLATCALDITKGAYANTGLYVKGATYVKIATIDPTTGEVKLVKNAETKAVLNAVGYKKGIEPLYEQFHAHIGVATANSCGVVEKTTEDKFYASWLRPINIFKSVKPAVDANTNGNDIKVLDCIKMYDWRGWKTAETEADCVANQSNMWGDNYWFWAYYGVSAISADLRYDNVKLQFEGSDEWVKLSSVTNDLALYGKTATGSIVRDDVLTSTFNLASYNNSAYNALVLRTLQAKLGSIHYTNNGDVVKKFSVKVPVTITYEWGEIKTDVVINIDATTGHGGK